MEKINYCRVILIKIKWSPWNPWCLGTMNLAWKKYTETPMYEGRKELEKNHPIDFEDFAYKAFIDNYEIKHFISTFTWKEKIKLLLAPFSFGSRFRMPFGQLQERILMKS